MPPLRALCFDLIEGTDGITTLDAVAATRQPAQHAAVLAELAQVQAWCRREFPHGQGPVDDVSDWDEDLQVQQDADGWHTVSLSLSASARFVQAFQAAFGPVDD